MSDLPVDALREKSRAIAVRVTDEMYANPFWNERFGARGRARAEEDAAFHLDYLGQALRLDEPEIMRGYARWLRTLLVSRGMCSRHLDESFARVGAAVGAEIPELHAPVVVLVDAARDSLRYAEGDAGALETIRSALEASISARLAAAHPAWDESPWRWRDDVGYQLSYLADALALDQPALFADYLASNTKGDGERPKRLLAILAETRAELARPASPSASLSAPLRERLLGVLSAGA